MVRTRPSPLLGAEEQASQPGRLRVNRERNRRPLYIDLSRTKELPDLAERVVVARLRSGRAAHTGQRIRSQDTLTGTRMVI
jgi:hypothetical protein